MVEACFGLGWISKEIWDKREGSWKGNAVLLRGVGRAEPMLLALGVELALKGLYLLGGQQKAKPDHRLDRLYKGLKSETKERLEKKFREECRIEAEYYGEPGIEDIYVGSKEGIQVKATMEGVLEKNKAMFTKNRYKCEKVLDKSFEAGELHRAIMTLVSVGMEMSEEIGDPEMGFGQTVSDGNF